MVLKITETVKQEEKPDFMKLEGKILSFLLKNMEKRKPIYSKDIQKKYRIKKAFACWLIRRLEKGKLIYRKKDGKSKQIFISKSGQVAIMSEVLTDDEIDLILIKKKSKSLVS